jgi:large subunit ribosomal protein L4
MKIKIHSQDGKAKGEQEVPIREDFKGVSPQVIHDTITAYRAAQRSGTANTKTVAEVAGSGKKPWRQKGTGRARAGLVRSPVWRKGGVVFGPKPRDYTKSIPKQVRKLAFEQALSTRIQDGDVIVLESLETSTPKTKDLVKVMKEFKITDKNSTLLIHESPSENLRRASNNIRWLVTERADSVNTYQLLNCDKIFVTQSALTQLASRQKGTEANS